jgi:hypothetical protein
MSDRNPPRAPTAPIAPGASPSAPPPFGSAASGTESVNTRMSLIEERLTGGNRAFSELRRNQDAMSSQIAVLHEKLTPKPANYFSIAMSMFGILVTILGAVWALSWLFSERPTRDEVQVRQREDRGAIDQLRIDYQNLRDKQTEQRTILDGLDKKVDQLLSRPASGRAARSP